MTFLEAKALYDSTQPSGKTWHAHRDVMIHHPQLLEINKAYWLELDRVFDDAPAADALRETMDAMGSALMERDDLKEAWGSWIKEQERRIHDEYELHLTGMFEAACKCAGVTDWVHPWLSTHFGDGSKDRDGNPHFSAWSPTKLRGIRVITHHDSRVPPQTYVDIFGKGEPDAVVHLVLIVSPRPYGRYDAKFQALLEKWVSGASQESILSFWVDTMAPRPT